MMEDLYPSNNNNARISSSNHHEISVVGNFITTSTTHHQQHGQAAALERVVPLQFQEAARSSSERDNEEEIIRAAGSADDDLIAIIKDQIASHPRYPNLLSAYIECRKVGAPPEMASLLEEISSEIHVNGGSCEMGADPELDDFMESYCEVLMRYKEELSKPFDEATTFLNKIEVQLSNLCKGTSSTTTTTTATSGSHHSADEIPAGSSEEELSCADIDATENQESSLGPRSGDQELKEMLLRKYSGYLSSLKKEFLKKRKKGKLPKDARVTLLDWWNTHYRWPYPTEEEKTKLAEVTGLDQKQINNWFINQRKRHWKPSEDMRFALMEGVSSTGG